MAANPKRKGMSTLPIYLPKVSAKRRGKSQQDASGESSEPRVYIEGGFNPSAAESLAQELTKSGLGVSVEGEIISALPRGPQLALRHAVATTARSLASSRIRSSKGREEPENPLRGEVDQEEASLHAHTHHEYEDKAALPTSSDLLYDGELVQAAFRELLPDPGSAINIVATSRALACWDESTNAWVDQAVVPGNPVLVGMGSGEASLDAASAAEQVRELLAQ